MNTVRHLAAVMMLATALALPGLASAEESVPSADPAASTPADPAVAMPPGMGQRMGMGPMTADRCQARKQGWAGMNKPCRGMARSDADARIESLEKRLDTMQLTLELLVRGQTAGAGQ